MSFFGKRNKRKRKSVIPEGLWVKCDQCQQLVFSKELKQSLMVCPKCDHHLIMTAWARIDMLCDEGTFVEGHSELTSTDPLDFKAVKTYKDKIEEDKRKTGLLSAAVVGQGKIDGIEVSLGVTDSRFIMGSMGSVVGEKLTRIVEEAIEKRIPVIIVSGSGGGARMYEGCVSLMQMVKINAALARLSKARLPYISVLTNPTMAGIMASFASVGDVIIAEPKALIGFTGPRVIRQTINQELPGGFQRSEFLLEHGMIDMILDRRTLRATVSDLLKRFADAPYVQNGVGAGSKPAL